MVKKKLGKIKKLTRRKNVDNVKPVKRRQRDDTLIEIPKEEKVISKLLITRGLPKQVLSSKSFILSDSLCSFTSEVEGLKPRRISKEKQIAFIQKVLENPFFAPYIMCISSNPNDLKAKQLAAFIMARAIKLQPSIKKLSQKELPIWHTLSGGFKNPLIDSPNKASLLIISNAPSNATNVKMESLRDALESYNNIPRIVITTGTDPVTLFNSTLHLHLNMCAMLTNQIVKKAVEI